MLLQLSSLPIEYQLKYGTACGDVNGSYFVGETALNSLGGTDVTFPQEKLFCGFWINPSPLVVDSLNSLLIGLNRR
jgi:hypothetical protein